MSTVSLVWLRRDLRLSDNAALYHALRSGQPVLPVFIFDREILDKLEDPQDARVTFIHQTLSQLQTALEAMGSSLVVKYGTPKTVWQELLASYKVSAVYANHDFEPYALERDAMIKAQLAASNIPFHTYKDHVIFEKDEVLKNDGTPYTVFTPYSRKWKEKLQSRMASWEQDGKSMSASYYVQPYPTEKYFERFYQTKPHTIPTLGEMGFTASELSFPSTTVKQSRIKNYEETRNFPANETGTSHLGIHFRFGTISIREKAWRSQSLSGTFLNELIWRDFYAMILSHFPHVVGNAFRSQYERIEWRNDPEEFAKWCAGKTGFPMVDAGMRELNTTGFMHNRVRMLTASFLTKHLLIDWRWGEAYFAAKLLDFDLASNNGGWQWAAGCGTDAAPYFRIFNPESQQKKFDKEGKYIRKWVPEYGTPAYPAPMVNHKAARERCLATYKRALKPDSVPS